MESRHRDRGVIALVALGLGSLCVGRLLETPLPEPAFSIGTAALLVGAHLRNARNARLLHRLRACCASNECALP